MLRFLFVILLLALTAPVALLMPNEFGGLPGWAWQVMAGAALFAAVVAVLLQRYWNDQ